MAGYKINTQKSVAFPYTNNEISEKQSLKEKSHLKFQQPRNKCNQGGRRLYMLKTIKQQ